MKKVTLSLVWILFGIPWVHFHAQEPGSDWRAYRGRDGSAVSLDSGLPISWGPQKNVIWKTELPGAGSSTPIVVGNRVFVTCYSGYNVPNQPRGNQANLKLHLVCLERSSGRILWTRDVAPNLPEQETIRDGHGYVSSTPVADDTSVITFFGKTGVHAFDHQGKSLWSAQVGSQLHGWGSGASLLLSGDHVIVNASVESGKLFALETSTGKIAWTVDGIRDSWNTPILVRHENRVELVLAIQGKILGIDPKAGKILWHCATDIPWYMVPSLVAHDGVVYAIGGRPGGGLAVRVGGMGDVTRTHRLWTSGKGGNVSSPIYHEGYLYWMHDSQGLAFCAEARSGKVVYQERLSRPDQIYGSPVLADGKIYYPGRSGTMYVVAAQPTFQLLASNTFGERGEHNASPAVAGSRLFLRTNRFAYCVGEQK